MIANRIRPGRRGSNLRIGVYVTEAGVRRDNLLNIGGCSKSWKKFLERTALGRKLVESLLLSSM